MSTSKSISFVTEEQVRLTLRHWHDRDDNATLSQLEIFRQAKIKLAQQFPTPRQITNHLLTQALDELALQSVKTKEASTNIRSQFVQEYTVAELVHGSGNSSSKINRSQQKGIQWLADYLHQQEQQARHQRFVRLEERLPRRTNDQLFGVTAKLAYLENFFQPSGNHHILLIEGAGGLGKSELASHFLRTDSIQSAYADVAWVSAQEQRFLPTQGRSAPVIDSPTNAASIIEQLARQCLPAEQVPVPFTQERVLQALHAHFHSLPSLVVLDNLETVQDLPRLLEMVARLANPTGFLLTGREKVLETPVWYETLTLSALQRTDALTLLRHEAHRLALDEVQQADDAALEPIWQMVGGNPLALRLVVGQLIGQGLATVLEDLHSLRSQSVKTMYDYLYGYAWQHLDEPTQIVLMSLTQFGAEGGDLPGIESLLTYSELPLIEQTTLHSALTHLVRLNLVAQSGSFNTQPRYTLHPLTRNFLLNQERSW